MWDLERHNPKHADVQDPQDEPARNTPTPPDPVDEAGEAKNVEAMSPKDFFLYPIARNITDMHSKIIASGNAAVVTNAVGVADVQDVHCWDGWNGRAGAIRASLLL